MAKAAQAAHESSAEEIVANLVAKNDPEQAIRDMVRQEFNQALYSTRNFEHALAVLFIKGVAVGASQKKPRKSRAKKPNGTAAEKGASAEA